MIKGIFFDAADIFYERVGSTSGLAKDLVKQLGLSAEVSEQELARQKDLMEQATIGRISYLTYWEEFLAMRGINNPGQRENIVRQVNDLANQVVAIPGGRAAMSGLKQRGFILGIVTDTMYPLEWKMNWLAAVGVAEFVDVVACSTVVGAHKPNPEIYLNALRQAKMQPVEAAFVGHDAGELEGARRVGMQTVAVNYNPGAKADYYAKSLVDLLNVPILQKNQSER